MWISHDCCPMKYVQMSRDVAITRAMSNPPIATAMRTLEASPSPQCAGPLLAVESQNSERPESLSQHVSATGLCSHAESCWILEKSFAHTPSSFMATAVVTVTSRLRCEQLHYVDLPFLVGRSGSLGRTRKLTSVQCSCIAAGLARMFRRAT